VGGAPDSIPEAERQRRGIVRLPADLGTALDSMEKSPLLRSALGEGLLGAFMAVHRYGLAAFAGRPGQEGAAAPPWRHWHRATAWADVPVPRRHSCSVMVSRTRSTRASPNR